MRYKRNLHYVACRHIVCARSVLEIGKSPVYNKSVAEQRAMSTVIRSHGHAFIILEIFVVRLPRFKSVTAQSQRDASITGEGKVGTAFYRMKYRKIAAGAPRAAARRRRNVKNDER